MAQRSFALVAEISTDDPQALAPAVAARFRPEEIERLPDGFRVSFVLLGPSARELNRDLLSYLRRTVRMTRLSARFSEGGVTERFFDYVAKGREG